MQQALGYYELGLLSEADEALASNVSEPPTVEFLHLSILVKIGGTKRKPLACPIHEDTM